MVFGPPSPGNGPDGATVGFPYPYAGTADGESVTTVLGPPSPGKGTTGAGGTGVAGGLPYQ